MSGSRRTRNEGDLPDASRTIRLATERDQPSPARADLEPDDPFRVIFEQAASGLALVSLDGRFLEVNARLAELLDFSREELKRMTLRDLTHPADLDSDLPQRLRLLSGEVASYSSEQRLVRHDTSVVWVERTVSLVRDESGNPAYLVCIFQDISARKYAEQEQAITAQSIRVEMTKLSRLERDLSRREETLSRMLDGHAGEATNADAVREPRRRSPELEVVLASAGSVAHDFKSLLAVIMSYSELITNERAAGHTTRHDAERITLAAKRANELASQLLALSRR